MISKQRACEAVRAGPPETKGWLLSFMGKVSDQELAAWDLEDTDEDMTIRDFILDRAQDARASGAVAATGPKAVTVVLPLLDGCETKYVAKILTLRDQKGLEGLLDRAGASGLEVVGHKGGPERVLLYLEDLEEGQYYKIQGVRDDMALAAVCRHLDNLGARQEVDATQGPEAGQSGKAGRLPPLAAWCQQQRQPHTTSTTNTLRSQAFGCSYGARAPRPLLAPRRVGGGGPRLARQPLRVAV